MSLLRNFANVGGLTLASRVLGFVRDMLMAQLLGTGMAADAFFAAFRFPNLFRRLFAEGAFNSAFIPVFARALEQEGTDTAYSVASRIVSWLLVVLVVVTVLAEIFMPVVLKPFVPGFLDDPAKYDLTVLLTRICFPYLAFMSLMAAFAGILNGLNRFTAAAAAPILLNVASIVFFVPMLALGMSAGQTTAVWVAIAIIAGGIAQLALVATAVRRAGFLPRLRWPRVDPEVRRFWFLAVPAILTGGITQINIFIGTIIASQADSAISYLYYADRLYQLPLGIIGIAIGTVLLPELARHLKGGRQVEAKAALDQSLLIAMLLAMPAALALIAIAEPIVRVLFERGAFTAEASAATAAALTGFAAGLPAFVLVRVLQPGFFAREDTRTPTLFAAISAAVNIALSLALFPSLQHVGIAIATSVSAWANAALLAATLLRRGHLALDTAQRRQQGLILLLSLGMAAVLVAMAAVMAPVLDSAAPFVLQLSGLMVLVAGGMVVYFGLVHLTGVQRLDKLLRRLVRRG
ncbi:MAG TPA: murein biosynthesis integral membrane protein MurJ [Devosiaceae bacterium]